jgi:hypothetical protein
MARRAAPPPLDAATILRLRAELESQYKTDDMQILAMREVRELKDKIRIDNRYTDLEVHDATIAEEIARNSATLSLNKPSVACTYPPGGSEPAEHNTALRELFYEELLEHASKRVEGENARVRCTDMCLGDGGGWKKVLFAKDLWEEGGVYRRRRPNESYAEYDAATESAKKDVGQPFVIRAIDPLGFYPVRNGTKLVGGLEVQRRPVTQTLLENGLTVGSDGEIASIAQATGQPQNKWDSQSLPTTVEFTEYWDEWRCYQVISGIGKNGFLLDPWEHGYGRPPYFWAPGFMMGHWANRKVGWGIGETKRSSVQYSSFLKTVLGDVAARDAYTPVIHTLGEQSAGQAQLQMKDGKPDWTEDVQLELRSVIREYPGDEWKVFPVRDTAPALIQAIEYNDKAIQQTLTPRVSSEIGGAGGLEGAGFAMTTVLAEAKIGHHPYVQSLEECDEAILDFIDYLIVNKVKGDVWLFAPPQAEDEKRGRKKRDAGWLKLGPSDISNYPVRRKVTVDPEKPTAKLVEGRYHIEQVNAHMESLDEAIIAQGRNPDQVREDLTKDRIRNSDWYMAKEDQDVAQEMGYGHLLAMSKLAAVVAQTGGLPGLQKPGPGGFPGEEAPGVPTATSAGVGTDQGQLAASAGGQRPDMAQPSNRTLGGTQMEVPQRSAQPLAAVGAQ